LNILAFSKNLTYGVGGAERSLLEELKKLSTIDNVTISSVSDVKAFNAENLQLNFPESFNFLSLKPRLLTQRFFYNEYLINRSRIVQHIKNDCSNFDELWAQNIWAPAAINAFDKKTIYFARDESFLNIRPNYFDGLKRAAKSIYNLIDHPGFTAYCRDNREAIENATEVVANSEFMAKEIKKIFGRTARVIYPFIDVDSLRSNYNRVKGDVRDEQKGVVLLGESKIKGIDTLKCLAIDFPKERFYVFSRAVSTPLIVQNITYMPWVRSPEEAYKFAKVVIAPSIWNEAYGRVAAESLSIDIPCLVNNIGGLPEAVSYNELLIANGYQDYKNKLKNLLN